VFTFAKLLIVIGIVLQDLIEQHVAWNEEIGEWQLVRNLLTQ